MATVWIHVFAAAGEVAMGPVLQEMTVAIGAGSVQSAAIAAPAGSGEVQRRVRLFADAKCHFAIGADPAADTSSRPLPAEGTEYFFAKSGEKIAVIQRS